MKGHGSSLASSRNCSLATLSGSNTASAFPGVPGWAVTAAWSRSRVKVAALLLGLAIGSQSQNSAATFTRRGLDQRLLLSSSTGYHDRKFELLWPVRGLVPATCRSRFLCLFQPKFALALTVAGGAPTLGVVRAHNRSRRHVESRKSNSKSRSESLETIVG